MTQMPRSYDHETQPHPYHLLQDLPSVVAAYPHVLSHMTPRIYVGYIQNDLQLSPAPCDDESNCLRLMNTSYSLVSAEIENIHPDRRNLSILQSSESESCYPWGPFHPSPNLLPSSTQGFPSPTFHHSHHSTPVPFPQPSLPTGRTQIGAVDEFLQVTSSSTIPFQNSAHPPRFSMDHTSMAGSRALGVSYPCQWTEGGVLCNIMVQATRPHMNRHLHEHHGFGGADTRQTSCHWAGCGETMQQGSIARHMVTCHFQAKVTCPMCSKKLSRQDVISKHQRICPAASVRRRARMRPCTV